jgi:MYXO-CTERM domain-containing protein
VAGTVCRAQSGSCDVAETCDGASLSCPVDGVASDTTVCRVAVDACDAAELCTGSSKTCPANAFQAAGTACGSAATSECNAADSCDGAGTCDVHHEVDGTACTDGTCVAGFCALLPVADAGSDAGPEDSGTGHVEDAGFAGTAGQGGSAGQPAFNLGGNDSGAGDSSADAGGGKGSVIGPGSSMRDAGLLDAGDGNVGAPGDCECALPGAPHRNGSVVWAALALFAAARVRRRKAA